MRGWDDEGELVGDYSPADAPTVDVEITDPTILGTLLGPDGSPLAYLVDRRSVPFGFQGHT